MPKPFKFLPVVLLSLFLISANEAFADVEQDIRLATKVCIANIEGKLDISDLQLNNFKLRSDRGKRSKKGFRQAVLKKKFRAANSHKSFQASVTYTTKREKKITDSYHHPQILCDFQWPTNTSVSQLTEWIGKTMREEKYTFDKNRSRTEYPAWFWQKREFKIRLIVTHFPKRSGKTSGRAMKRFTFAIPNET